MRAPRGTSATPTDDLKERISDLFTLFSAFLADDFAFISSEWALTDSDIFYPSASLPTAVVGEQLVADFSLQQRATSTGFVGRAAGSRASLFLYGLWWDDGAGTPRDNGRVTPAEATEIGSATAICTSWAKAGSGEDAVFHNYANIKVNDHLLKLLRRGSIV
jgi:hypothetical protein